MVRWLGVESHVDDDYFQIHYMYILFQYLYEGSQHVILTSPSDPPPRDPMVYATPTSASHACNNS